jgi:LacI family transcriptional regulator
MAITLEEIAKLAGVSRSTASRAANGQPGVSKVTRERVLRIIRENGYQPNAEARSLAAQRLRKHPF